MHLALRNIERPINSRLKIVQQDICYLDSNWDCHEHYELLYVTKGEGTRFVGDSVDPFTKGDLVLIGPYLPHLWRNDLSHGRCEQGEVFSKISLTFSKNFIGEKTFENPAFSSINHLLKASKAGIQFGEEVGENLHHELLNISSFSKAEQSIRLLALLLKLSLTKNKRMLSSIESFKFQIGNSQRIDLVLDFISENYSSYISLEKIADVACLTTNSFCRYFKKMTNKSFTRFLNEVRVRNAARLLIQEDLPVSEVGYMVGYKSVSNFNKQFKRIMGNTPNGFRHTF